MEPAALSHATGSAAGIGGSDAVRWRSPSGFAAKVDGALHVGNGSGLLGKPSRGTMRLKSAAIWGTRGEPIMPRVTYFHEITLEDVPGGQTLLDVSIRHRIPHFHQCGGHGRCTTCRVQILDGLSNVSSLGEVEQKVASRRGWDECTRLACQTRVEGDVVIRRLLDKAQDIIVLDLDEIAGGTAGEGKNSISRSSSLILGTLRSSASRACPMTSCTC
jgi:ferredoxin